MPFFISLIDFCCLPFSPFSSLSLLFLLFLFLLNCYLNIIVGLPDWLYGTACLHCTCISSTIAYLTCRPSHCIFGMLNSLFLFWVLVSCYFRSALTLIWYGNAASMVNRISCDGKQNNGMQQLTSDAIIEVRFCWNYASFLTECSWFANTYVDFRSALMYHFHFGEFQYKWLNQVDHEYLSRYLGLCFLALWHRFVNFVSIWLPSCCSLMFCLDWRKWRERIRRELEGCIIFHLDIEWREKRFEGMTSFIERNNLSFNGEIWNENSSLPSLSLPFPSFFPSFFLIQSPNTL